MSQTIQVTLSKSPVELYKILKFEGIAASGAEAKMMVEQGLVRVNNEAETRKRRKIIGGDRIQIDDIYLVISD
ncbi:RNA-binding S4 domain-containing protein [Methylophaga sp. OBS1]|uniref:RNA-binding S4 domain-containing protein n=1 Tax=Methylophaga sp. OBS1 TaxID=2991933 RepID=UPI0022502D65|nr:RNA-binding S4 domain-containing protein [Methylophaga sp. OBS1]MCX4191479.1 RNA-binding S4 domain-containing protein [Methylophaga sp. OBS1]MCX4191576.1 RNA-binding S4 domain-containing protein [Methylophaga sp. OBS1]